MNTYINILEEYLNTERINHCKRVADCAYELALKFNTDHDQAYIAGLLHDISKQMDYKWQISILQEYKLEHEDFYLIPSIHHAYTARKLLEKISIDNEIITAIENHVEGSAKIDELGMILYIADFIEPNRKFKEADIVRDLENTSLEELYATCLVYTYKYLKKNKLTVTYKTKLAIDKYKQYAIIEEDI